MKTLKLANFLTFSASFLSVMVVFSSVSAQEYDDMYFSKSDRKTVKVEKTNDNKSTNTANYKEVTKSTDTYSAKNINPEYIARYKSTESNEVSEQQNKKDDTYSSQDYFVEDYDNTEYTGDPNQGKIDYAALNKRDQMSSPSNYNRSFSNPSWRFSPYAGMGFGYPSYGGGYGYDPYMMGYGSGMTMGYGSGFGYSPSMAFNIGMSWGSGYNPWNRYSSYSPYGMRGFNDPWGSMYGYNSFSRYGQSPYSNNGYGGFCPSYVATSYANNNGDTNGRNIKYQPRTSRTSVNQKDLRNNNSENVRVSSSNAKIRVANRDISTSTSNGRVSRDYSKVQNEYYNDARRTSSSTQRISSGNKSSRTSSSRGLNSSSRYSSSINNNKPSRTSSYSSGNSSRSSSSYSSGSSGRSSSSSYSTPTRGSSSSSGRSSFSSGNSGSRSSSSSSGSSSSSSRSSGGSSRGGRQ